MKRFVLIILLIVYTTSSCNDDDPINLDVVPPSVVSQYPTQNEPNVPIDTSFHFQFNEEIATDGLSESISLSDGTDSFNFELVVDSSNAITIIPVDKLPFRSEIQLRMDSIFDLNGNKIDEFRLNFSTEDFFSVKYLVEFDAIWTRTTHPNDFPDNPHFSGLIGATHDEGSYLFKTGELASTGIKNMAETGSKLALTEEISILQNSGKADFLIDGPGVPLSPEKISVEIEISQSHSFVSITTMIAPSPDWFVGISSINLFENESWVDNLTVNGGSYDSGTDSGTTFTSSNQITDPFVPVFEIIEPPLAVNGEVEPLGRFVFTRIE